MRIAKSYPVAVKSFDSDFFESSRTLVVDREENVAEVSVVPDGVMVDCRDTLRPDEAEALAGMLIRASAVARNRGSDVVGDGDVTLHEQAEQEAAVADGQDGVAVDSPSVVHQVDESGIR